MTRSTNDQYLAATDLVVESPPLLVHPSKVTLLTSLIMHLTLRPQTSANDVSTLDQFDIGGVLVYRASAGMPEPLIMPWTLGLRQI